MPELILSTTHGRPEEIQQSEFPTLTQIIHRFDFIFIFIENTGPEHLREYTRRREEIAKKSTQGVFDDYDNFLRKYLMYARTFNPTISAEAKRNVRLVLDKYGISWRQRSSKEVRIVRKCGYSTNQSSRKMW